MSDVPPPVGSYNSEIQQSNSSEDELRTESALRKIVKQEIQLMMTRQELEKTVIDILHRTLGTTMEDSIRRIIQLKEQFELEMKKFLPNAQRIGENDMHTSQPRRLSLQFRNGLSLPILTGWEIKGNGSTSIEVALIDDLSGQVVESGPEANANVEIVVLKGNLGESDNWTSEEFNSSIGTRGTKSLLAGNVDVKLIKGVGVVGNIKFRHSQKHMKKDEFKLGAKVKQSFSGTNIREAKTETFTVSDKRNEYKKKPNTPCLTDEVCRLKNIDRDRKIHKRLQEQNIYTVRDFLDLHFKDPEWLKHIVGLESKKWEVTVENARKCKIDKRMTCYIDSSIPAAMNPSIPQGLEFPRGQNVEGSEMTVRCSHTRSNACFEDITSSSNIVGSSTTHSRSLSIRDYEILQCQPFVEQDTSSAFDFETMFPGFDEFVNRLEQEVQPWKRWVVLINVLSLRWESMRKSKVTLQKLPVRKRQRIS